MPDSALIPAPDKIATPLADFKLSRNFAILLVSLIDKYLWPIDIDLLRSCEGNLIISKQVGASHKTHFCLAHVVFG